jgi:protease PrsW
MDYDIIIYTIFGVLPSLTWLFYYLARDLHPEPKKMILKIFLWGSLITLPVFFVQIGLTKLLGSFGTSISPTVNSIIYWFIIISFSEELFKYLVVRVKVVDSPHLDEPLDIMLYMVVAALGFTAVENILYLFSPIGQMSLDQIIDRTLLIAFIRFIGATFLHTLCSAIIGYSLAISFCHVKIKHVSLALGILLATLLHGLYDFSIMTLDGNIKFAVPAVIILTLAFLTFIGFEKLKKMKSICKIK